jgi:DHA2 family multidrug resistance protein
MEANPWKTLACVVTGVFVVILDTTVVNVAFPTLQREYGATLQQAQWIVSLYVLVLGITTPIAGWLADRFGLRRMFLLGLSLFTLGSAACGVAPSLSWLIGGRILQAVGGGMTQPAGMALLYRAFPPARLGRAFGVFGLALLVAPALGPVLGGALVDGGHWRWIFFINLPVGLWGVLIGSRWLNEWRRPDTPPLDRVGVVLSCLGFGSVLYAAASARAHGFGSTAVLVAGTVGVAALLLLWIVEHRSHAPLLDVGLLKHRVFLTANVVGYVGVVGLFAAQFLLPLFLESIRGLSPGQVGLVLLAQPLAAAVATPLSGRLYDHIGPRAIASVGFLLLAVSTWELVQLDAGTSLSHIRFVLVLRGLAFGMTIQTTFTTALAVVARERVARASAFVSATRFTIQAVSIAVLSAIVGGGDGTQYAAEGFAAAYTVTLIFSVVACALATRLPGWPGPWGGRAAMAPPQGASP